MVPEIVSKVSSKMGCSKNKNEGTKPEEDTKTEEK